MAKCNDLEKEIAESQENHVRDTEEWKKFQADLQTAVRVANDFMMGKLSPTFSVCLNSSKCNSIYFFFLLCFAEAEEKVNKMKEDYVRAKEKEQLYVDEIEKLKKKVSSLEGAKLTQYQSTSSQPMYSTGFYKQTKGLC
jgi:hypothetical protein